MNETDGTLRPDVGSADMQLPDGLRGPVMKHLEHLRGRFEARGWGSRTGFGQRPAVVVIDLALFWTQPQHQMGSQLDPLVDATCRILDAARAKGVPIFFTTNDYDPADPPTPQSGKMELRVEPGDLSVFDLDPRLGRRPTEKIIGKKYASCFKGTNFSEMLSSLSIDTLIVTGVSTSHCVYATCRDAADSYHVIVPRQAVGERCELFHEVNLLDIDMELGDVMPTDEVVDYLQTLR